MEFVHQERVLLTLREYSSIGSIKDVSNDERLSIELGDGFIDATTKTTYKKRS